MHMYWNVTCGTVRNSLDGLVRLPVGLVVSATAEVAAATTVDLILEEGTTSGLLLVLCCFDELSKTLFSRSVIVRALRLSVLTTLCPSALGRLCEGCNAGDEGMDDSCKGVQMYEKKRKFDWALLITCLKCVNK